MGGLRRKLRKKRWEDFEGGGGDLTEKKGRQEQHSGWLIFGFCFVLTAAWLVVETLRCASDFVEQLCNVLMQLIWRVDAEEMMRI